MELSNFSQVVLKKGAATYYFPPGNRGVAFSELEVGDNFDIQTHVIPAGRAAIITLFDYSTRSARFEYFGMYNDSGAGTVNVALEIVKPTSTTDDTPAAWDTFVSAFSLSCGSVLALDTPECEITNTRNNMGALSGSDPQPFATADASVSTGYIRKIKVNNPGTADVTLKTLTVWA